jgi:YegS/Rv2252/BmrU family lipid kinase
MNYFLLVNPHAGSGRAREIADTLYTYLDNQQINYIKLETTKSGQETELVAKYLTDHQDDDRLIVLGGDGTISLVVDQLPNDMPFSYIPAGSGNDFARALEIPRDPIAAFQAIENGEVHDINILRYQSETLNGYALNNIGIGLDGAIIKATSNSRLKRVMNKLKLGQLSYLLSALHVLFTKKSFKVSANDEHFDNALIFTIAKHPYFGGGIPIAPDASSFDDSAHLVVIDRVFLPKLFSLIPSLIKGQHLDKDVTTYVDNKTFTITPESDQPVQVDGEVAEISANETLHITVDTRKMRF